MPKKTKRETPAEQSERFKKAAQEMIDAGELSPTEAEARFQQAMEGVARLHRQWVQDAEED